tara:strand:+ start:1633 stop:2223 length:591 start_codon:yes stop_codon:yes gene_type:complete
MSKKFILQIILFSFIILIIGGTFYYINRDKKNDQELSNVDTERNQKKESKKKSSIIKNIKYTSSDNEGNKYEIIAKLGEVDFNNQEIINMQNVKAIIALKDSEVIIINSDFAKYNTKNYDTQFSENVLMTYDEHIIRSKNLDLFFEKHIAQAMNNLVYENNTSRLRADKIEIDLITKNSKIFMYNKKQKIKISGKI